MQKELLSILKKLVSFPSVTPKGEEALIYIAELLKKLGFDSQLKSFGEDPHKTFNLYARYGTTAPNICFAGHVDVVPPLNRQLWLHDPYQLNIKEGKIYGRGTVDMKGAIACYLTAINNYLTNNSLNSGSISLLLTSDEEGEALYGTKIMLTELQKQNEKIDFCILGEPTSQKNFGDTIKIGRRGSINFEVIIEGKQGHVAYPEQAINPLTILAKLLKELTDLKLDDGSEYFQPSNLEITSIDSNNKVSNIIPATVKLMFNIRFNNLHNEQSLINKINDLIKIHSPQFTLNTSCNSLPFIQKYSSNMQKFANIVAQECNVTPQISTNGGTSDARFIHFYTEIIEFGLACAQAHTINEYTKLSDLQKLCNVYYRFLIKIFENS